MCGLRDSEATVELNLACLAKVADGGSGADFENQLEQAFDGCFYDVQSAGNSST